MIGRVAQQWHSRRRVHTNEGHLPEVQGAMHTFWISEDQPHHLHFSDFSFIKVLCFLEGIGTISQYVPPGVLWGVFSPKKTFLRGPKTWLYWPWTFFPRRPFNIQILKCSGMGLTTEGGNHSSHNHFPFIIIWWTCY